MLLKCSVRSMCSPPVTQQLQNEKANRTEAIVVSFSGGARQASDSRLACRMFPSATAMVPITTMELVLHFGAFAAFLCAVLKSLISLRCSQRLILTGHSLGVNLAQAVARHLERLGVDVLAIVAMDPRCSVECLLRRRLAPALRSASPANVRLGALQLTCRAPFVRFLLKLEYNLRVDSEMAKDATVAIETARRLLDTDHNSIPDHTWDITTILKAETLKAGGNLSKALSRRHMCVVLLYMVFYVVFDVFFGRRGGLCGTGSGIHGIPKISMLFEYGGPRIPSR